MSANRLEERSLDTWITLGLVIIAALLYLPFLGSYALWDPWEAHYSQVAMEMIGKNTWWFPWYQGSDRTFWSKPIFTFWLMLCSLKSFRIAQVGDFAQAEFYLRLPIALFGAIGIGFMYTFVRRLWNRTAAILTALVLATCPQYFLISRQVMVDIPFVVLQMSALGFLALGLFGKLDEDDDKERKRGIVMALFYAGAGVALQLTEVIYWQVRLKQSFFTSFQQSNYLWLALTGFFLVWAIIRATVRNPQTRAFYLFFFFSGLAALAKGLLSVVLPGGIVLFYIVVTGDWDLLRRMRLVYIPKRIKQSTSVILAITSVIVAVWFISFPMLKSLLRLTNGGRKILHFALGTGKGAYQPINKFLSLPVFQQLNYSLMAFGVLLLLVVVIGGKSWDEYLKAFFFNGMLVYLIVGGSWVAVMCYRHGLPFMDEWFMRHHFGRMAGTIEKPNNSFDLYIKQIGFGIFPWSAMIPIALIRFMNWRQSTDQTSHFRRNLFFFCCFFFPYVFYTISSTKFHHYIFPVVPFLAIIVGVWLSRLFQEQGAWTERLGIGASLLLFALLAKDMVTSYKPLYQMFTYYVSRTPPVDVDPNHYFKVIFGLFAVVLISFMLVRRVRFTQFGLLLVPVMLYVLHVNVRIIPAVGANFSFKSVYMKYKELAGKQKLPFGEYANWDERSTSFYSKNSRVYLGSTNAAKRFLRRSGTLYVMAPKSRIRQISRLARQSGKRLYIVDKRHYDMRLLSTDRSKVSGSGERIVLNKAPNMNNKYWKRLNVNFGNKLRMVGVKVSKPDGFKRGEKVKVIFLFKVTGKITKDWGGFIHVDPTKWTRNRLNWDHELAEGLYPTSEWKVGTYIQNVVVRRIPLNYPRFYNRLYVYMGLWIGNSRMPVLSSGGAYHDGQNRVRAVTLKLVPEKSSSRNLIAVLGLGAFGLLFFGFAIRRRSQQQEIAQDNNDSPSDNA